MGRDSLKQNLNSVVSIENFFKLIIGSKYNVYTKWFEEVIYDVENLKDNDNVLLVNLLTICERVLAYEDRDNISEFLEFVESSLKITT